MTVNHEDRCIGCLLGVACGDILGAAVEGLSASSIREMCGELRDFMDTSRGFGCYTDDTQMTLALAASLVECGCVDAEHVSAKYAEFYEPWRGYGGAAHRVMQALKRGAVRKGRGPGHHLAVVDESVQADLRHLHPDVDVFPIAFLLEKPFRRFGDDDEMTEFPVH